MNHTRSKMSAAIAPATTANALPRVAPTLGHHRAASPLASGSPPSALEGSRLRLLRFPAIQERTGLSRTTIWRLERRGDFPRHHLISPNAVAWVEEEVLAWLRARISAPPGAARLRETRQLSV
jgi:prophage regulatory protein